MAGNTGDKPNGKPESESRGQPFGAQRRAEKGTGEAGWGIASTPVLFNLKVVTNPRLG